MLAEMATNILFSMWLPLFLALLFIAYFLFVSPLVGPWIASGRYAQGWFLGGKRTSEVDDDWGTAVRRVESIQPTRVPLKIKVVSSAYANWRWIYNKALLPRVPLVGFTVGQLLVVVVYQVVTNLFLLVYNLVLPENFRRPAFLAVSQLPCVFALATKNNILSIIGKGSEKLNFLHRTVGNEIIVFGLLHAFLIEKQLNFKPDLTKRIYLTGVITASSLILILIGSFPIIRHKAYQLFLFTHILGWLTFIIALNFHVPLVAFPFTAVALGLYALDLGLRLAKTRVKNATLVALPGGVTMIQVHDVSEGWRAGQFVWLRVPMWRMGRMGRRAMEAHPFTIANSAAAKSPLPGRHNLTVLVKAAGDWSRSCQHRDVSGRATGRGRREPQNWFWTRNPSYCRRTLRWTDVYRFCGEPGGAPYCRREWYYVCRCDL